MGVPEAVMDSIRSCPSEVMPHLLPNIIVVGGCALFPGMQTRLEMDIRSLAPDDCNVSVTVPEKYFCCIIFVNGLFDLSGTFLVPLRMPGMEAPHLVKIQNSLRCV